MPAPCGWSKAGHWLVYHCGSMRSLGSLRGVADATFSQLQRLLIQGDN